MDDDNARAPILHSEDAFTIRPDDARSDKWADRYGDSLDRQAPEDGLLGRTHAVRNICRTWRWVLAIHGEDQDHVWERIETNNWLDDDNVRVSFLYSQDATAL